MTDRILSLLVINQIWLVPEFKALGHRVVSVGCRESGVDIVVPLLGIPLEDILAMLPEDFHPDAIVYFDDSGPLWFTGIERSTIPILFYSVDTHHHHVWHPFLAAAVDLTLVAQRDYIPFIAAKTNAVEWCPLWAPRLSERREARSLDACFRGTLDQKLHPHRAAFFDRLRSLAAVDAERGDYFSAYEKAKIVVNETVAGDLNYRVFEAMACGALLLTPRTGNGLDVLFRDGEQIVTYSMDSHEEAAEKINYYLSHEQERQRIADAGYQAVASFHTPLHRAQLFIRYLQDLEVRQKPNRNFAAARCYLLAATILSPIDSVVAVPFLVEACSNLVQSAERQEQLDQEFVASIVLCSHYLEELGLGDLANVLVQTAVAYYPEDVLLRIAQLERIVTSAGEEAALEYARQFSTAPEEIVASAPRLFAEVRERIDTELQSWRARLTTD